MTSRFLYVTFIQTTPEKLWDALTLPAFTRQYWASTYQESDWVKGSSWKMFDPNGRLADGGEILEIDRPRKLVVSWRNEFVEALKAEGFTRATFEIEPMKDECKLTVTHESDVPDSKMIEAVSGGWPAILSSLKTLLETGASLKSTRDWPDHD